VLAAIFGMMIESWQKAGFTMTESDFQGMLLVIGALSIAHFFALIAYFAGDQVRELLSDADGDGIPDVVDRVDNRTGKPFVRQIKSDGIKKIEVPENVYNQLLIDAGVGKGSNGHKAVADPTDQSRR
jgi:hypothetical protein